MRAFVQIIISFSLDSKQPISLTMAGNVVIISLYNLKMQKGNI